MEQKVKISSLKNKILILKAKNFRIHSQNFQINSQNYGVTVENLSVKLSNFEFKSQHLSIIDNNAVTSTTELCLFQSSLKPEYFPFMASPWKMNICRIFWEIQTLRGQVCTCLKFPSRVWKSQESLWETWSWIYRILIIILLLWGTGVNAGSSAEIIATRKDERFREVLATGRCKRSCFVGWMWNDHEGATSTTREKKETRSRWRKSSEELVGKLDACLCCFFHHVFNVWYFKNNLSPQSQSLIFKPCISLIFFPPTAQHTQHTLMLLLVDLMDSDLFYVSFLVFGFLLRLQLPRKAFQRGEIKTGLCFQCCPRIPLMLAFTSEYVSQKSPLLALQPSLSAFAGFEKNETLSQPETTIFFLIISRFN